MSKILGFVRSHGPTRFANCVLCRAFLYALRAFFRFDPWHASAALACRPYKEEAVKLAQSASPALAVEIGCGLGAIIARVTAARRVGLDLSPQAIAAARFINGRRARFAVASLFEVRHMAEAVGEGPIDVLIMVNWVNALSVKQIVQALDELDGYIAVRHLLIDETPPATGLHCHTPQALRVLGEVIDSWRDTERALHLVRLAPRSVNRETSST